MRVKRFFSIMFCIKKNFVLYNLIDQKWKKKRKKDSVEQSSGTFGNGNFNWMLQTMKWLKQIPWLKGEKLVLQKEAKAVRVQ